MERADEAPRQHDPSTHGVTGVLAAAGVARQDAVLDQIGNVPLSGGERAFAKDGPLSCGQGSLKPIEIAAEDRPLVPTHHHKRVGAPEFGSAQNPRADGIRPVNGAGETGQEPLQPVGDIQAALLGALQDRVVVRTPPAGPTGSAPRPLRPGDGPKTSERWRGSADG